MHTFDAGVIIKPQPNNYLGFICLYSSLENDLKEWKGIYEISESSF